MSGNTLVASAKTICSFVVSTLPHELASFKVELLHAPSLESATVICAELLGKNVDMHKYAIQITVADSRDGACSSSTLKEASSWGKVDSAKEQMVFAEATSVLPLIVSDAYHTGAWKNRDRKKFSKIF